jgi:hypothetical protein
MAAGPMIIMAGLICITMGGYLFNLELNHFNSSDPSSPKVIWDLITVI